jgi:D-glycerate 3-kinase
MIENNEYKKFFLKVKKSYLKYLRKQEVLGEPFHDKIGQLKNIYIPICSYIFKQYILSKKTIIIGLSGGQGSGKTTITNILKIILKKNFNLNVVSFSIDDFYKTLNERKKMSNKEDKLFLTRGVPGTHDISFLKKTLNNLKKKDFKKCYVPKFNKSIDDRYPKNKWNKVKKKPEIVIFEGWCVGAKHQSTKKLKKPINLLEKNYDKGMKWRIKVNNELKNRYKFIFKQIDKLIFLQVPNFNYVYKWRTLQEKKLKFMTKGKKIMSDIKIKEFIMFYERITRQMLIDLKHKANIVIKLDKKHRLVNIKFN